MLFVQISNRYRYTKLKSKLSKLLGKKFDEENTLLQQLKDEGLILGIEAKSEEATVYFYGRSIDLIKSGLRKYVLDELIFGSDHETNMGRH